MPMGVNESPVSRQVLTFVFAGGGSGGHIAPGLAIAERLAIFAGPALSIRSVSLCSERAIDAQMLSAAGATFHPLPAQPPSIRPRAAIRFLRSFARSRSIARDLLLRELEGNHVIALGGFAAAPVVAAARSLRIPVTLINLDDPPGRANRWIARRATNVWSAINLPASPTFASSIVGMPIRRDALAETFGDQQSCRIALGLEPDRKTLLVTGASQGAGSVNALMTALAQHYTPHFGEWQVLHLTGAGADAEVREVYQRAGIKSIVLSYLNEMGCGCGAADLALSRAGASSVAEAAANCVPTLFLPYPHHKDQHQRRNAQPLVAFGGAALAHDHVETAANLNDAGATLLELMKSPGTREAMREKLIAHRPPDAARTIADQLMANVKRSKGQKVESSAF